MFIVKLHSIKLIQFSIKILNISELIGITTIVFGRPPILCIGKIKRKGL